MSTNAIKTRPLAFPKNFVWGFAAAAPQIEGAAFEDNKGPSIWDTFARQPGAVHNGDNLDVACDHYHLYKKDFALMARLGAKHYRLSIAWPRIFPMGKGAVNQKGLDFYKRLLDSMHDHGLTPWVTMFHWDLPQALEDEGGWRVRSTADAFATYADTIVQNLSSRVKNWITLNEIVCFTRLAYGIGEKAPGTKESEAVVNQTYHTALLAHGHGVRAVREHGGRGARVGLTDNSTVPIPVTETERDIAAARTAFINDNIRVLDPIYRGHYSATYRRITGKDAAKFQKKDFELISLPTDFLGQNIYSGYFVRAGKGGKPEQLPFPPGYPRADAPWLAHAPQAIYWGPRHAAEIYDVGPVYITENGAGYDDLPPVKGEVHDLHRRDLVRNYLKEVHRAIGDGVPLKGYFLWSFMDNFEWQDGYNRRFGVVYCDFTTQKRTPKTSALWYSRVMQENRIV
ncbi:beta-glucosidase [Opitutaceae bacterium TAV4]|uniref:GH1 family beta-glucosidase n=1 Tax=Geminisphaera colitermitum TaxID=1148786 RepID=UPI000158CBF4|nr:GH1 family beta-glucosidase [Geminisphaera colitermitum]RRJ94254.1 beta-glucosidase [Opitutaceae bacterium TAV4]RRJ98345.1 beta-glucosidase [Opitutaceae bacterium TAV3]